MDYKYLTFKTERSRIRIARILKLLETPMTRDKLEECGYMSKTTAIYCLRHLRECTPPKIFISGYEERFQNRPAPVYSLGAGPDVQPPRKVA